MIPDFVTTAYKLNEGPHPSTHQAISQDAKQISEECLIVVLLRRTVHDEAVFQASYVSEEAEFQAVCL